MERIFKNNTHLSFVAEEKVGVYLAEYCWLHRQTRSQFIRGIIEKWYDEQMAIDAKCKEEGILTEVELRQAVADGHLTAKDAGLR